MHWLHTCLAWLLAVVGVPLFSSVSPTTWSHADAFEPPANCLVCSHEPDPAWNATSSPNTAGTWQPEPDNGAAGWISSTWSGNPIVALHRGTQRLKVSLESSGEPKAADVACVGNPSHAARVFGAARLPVATAPWPLRLRATGWVRAPGGA